MIDTYSYFNGISAAIYFLACLLCGLQLILDLPFQRNSGNLFLSRLVGTILLGLSCTVTASLSPSRRRKILSKE